MTNDIRYGGLLGLPRQPSPDGTGGILGQFFAPPAEEPGSNLWPINAGGAWPPPTLGLDTYLSPMPPPPNWYSVPARASAPSATEILPESVNLSPWGPHPFGADAAPSDEPAAAEAARRIAAERLRRGAWRPAAKPWKGAVFGPPPAHLDSAEYWGASISPPDASEQPSTHGFHLSPVPPAPSWEQVVPTGSPWSVAPRLPSPTAWGGDALSGHECYTSAGKLHCITAGGRRLTVPADGLPDGLRIAPGERHYHSYGTPDGPVRLDPATLMQGVIDSPTVGPPRLVRPAIPHGTQNEATPSEPYNALVGLTAAAAPFGHPLPPVTSFNPVKSYLTTDQNGTPMVVNVTQPGHGLSPGVVIRYVTTSPSGSTIQTEGTGLGAPQGLGILGYFRDNISNVWKGQAEDIIRKQSERRR